uniref:C2HC/C3H-type domain-containing protein n=1 Tax=Gopherus agassizii TaxID=38772 RepID=A0A452IZZ9_9SAUR
MRIQNGIAQNKNFFVSENGLGFTGFSPFFSPVNLFSHKKSQGERSKILRHEPICRKVFNKKRKTFNSLKQRLQGTEIPSVKKQPPPKKQPEKKSNWRQLHEDFINAIQSAKQVAKAMKEGRPLPPPPPPSINPDYIQCPYCLRRFNEAAAERHISFCKEQATRRVFAPGQKAAKQGKQQMTQRREPTLTSAVESLLQNRAQEAAIAGKVAIDWVSEHSEILAQGHYYSATGHQLLLPLRCHRVASPCLHYHF